MILLYATIALISFLLVLGFVMQVVMPAVQGRPLFPALRSATPKEALESLEDKLEEAINVADIQARVSALAETVNSKLKNGKVK